VNFRNFYVQHEVQRFLYSSSFHIGYSVVIVIIDYYKESRNSNRKLLSIKSVDKPISMHAQHCLAIRHKLHRKTLTATTQFANHFSLTEIGLNGVDGIHLAQVRMVQWLRVNTEMSFSFFLVCHFLPTHGVQGYCCT
jgi:hypothetical protein